MRPGEPSLLFRDGPAVPGEAAEVDGDRSFAADLHLDEIVAAAPDVGPWFFDPLRDPNAVAYRHEVFRDLEAADLFAALTAFVAAITAVRERLQHASAIAHPMERQRWHLDAAATYRDAVGALVVALDAAPIASRALTTFRGALRTYLASAPFETFAADTDAMGAALDGVTYRLRIGEHRVRVSRHDDEADYGAEVVATFARFRRSAVAAPVPVDVFRTADMNRVESGILERVARLHPAVFRDLAAYAQRHATFLDPVVTAAADELRFYLGWLGLVQPLRDAGIAFCFPDVAAAATEAECAATPHAPDATLDAAGLVDLALALRRIPAGQDVVANDVTLGPGERILVVTGPNQGGKTSFARAIGQLQHLAAIGVPVPAARARVTLGAGIHSVFARAEDPADLTGRLEAELTRARDILAELQPGGLVIMNESFASTTVDDGLALNRALLGEMTKRGAVCVVVTFLGELATFDAATVSMVCVMDPLDPTRPTYRLERRPADDLAHARAVADVHRLDHAAVRARVTRRPADAEATGRPDGSPG